MKLNIFLVTLLMALAFLSDVHCKKNKNKRQTDSAPTVQPTEYADDVTEYQDYDTTPVDDPTTTTTTTTTTAAPTQPPTQAPTDPPATTTTTKKPKPKPTDPPATTTTTRKPTPPPTKPPTKPPKKAKVTDAPKQEAPAQEEVVEEDDQGDYDQGEEEVVVKENCNNPDILDRYNCTYIPGAVYDYFGGDLSTMNLLGRLYSDNIVNDLMNCQPGSWCLPYTEHMKIKKNLPAFYMQGPYCSNAMQCSLDRMLEQRFHCNEPHLVFLVNSVALLCDLKRSEDFYHVPTCGDNDECYARTKEAMYVLYQDVVKPQPKHKDKLHSDKCNDYKEQMAKTYVCADKCCQFSQQEILKRFEMWDGMADDAEEIHYKCNITSKCQVDIYADEERKKQMETQELLDEEMDAIGGMVAEVGNITEALEEESNVYDNFGDFGGMEMPNNDHTMIYATVVIAVMMAIALGFILFVLGKKFKRGKGYDQFFKRGYSELTEEETKMLRNEYN